MVLTGGGIAALGITPLLEGKASEVYHPGSHCGQILYGGIWNETMRSNQSASIAMMKQHWCSLDAGTVYNAMEKAQSGNRTTNAGNSGVKVFDQLIFANSDALALSRENLYKWLSALTENPPETHLEGRWVHLFDTGETNYGSSKYMNQSEFAVNFDTWQRSNCKSTDSYGSQEAFNYYTTKFADKNVVSAWRDCVLSTATEGLYCHAVSSPAKDELGVQLILKVSKNVKETETKLEISTGIFNGEPKFMLRNRSTLTENKNFELPMFANASTHLLFQTQEGVSKSGTIFFNATGFKESCSVQFVDEADLDLPKPRPAINQLDPETWSTLRYGNWEIKYPVVKGDVHFLSADIEQETSRARLPLIDLDTATGSKKL